jgi:transcriptional regulator with XRE-family HTH domain
MARTGKTLQPLDAAIAAILAERIEAQGASRRTLAVSTGMSANRIGIILRGEQPPATVGEVRALAGECGLTAGQVVALAEAALTD